MKATVQELLNSALSLPDADRAALAAGLIESLDPRVDENAEVAWDAEIKRRIGELDAGSVATVSWPEARRVIMGQPHGRAGR